MEFGWKISLRKKYAWCSYRTNSARAIGSRCLLTGQIFAVDLGMYKTCPLTDGDFKEKQLYTGPGGDLGVLKMSLVGQQDGTVDIYFVQKHGEVIRINGKNSSQDILDTLPVDFFGEYGLVGIATDPEININGLLYVIYTASENGNNFRYNISRFKLITDKKKLDKSSEKILMTFPAKRKDWHSAGAMAFDAYGDLYIAIGDNMQVDEGPGNTADYRGGILRIHPDVSYKGYSIPKGNFAEVFSAAYKSQGNDAMSKDYLDTSKVKPEIYVKGTCNAYTIQLDPVRRWLAWGDVGPDQGKVFGIKNLPAIEEPIYPKVESCAMTGPIFRYDGRIKSVNNFPPQFNRKWIVNDCNASNDWKLLSLNDAGDKVISNIGIFKQFDGHTIVDIKQGPNGALYYVSWNAGIFRIDYTGSCKDQSLVPEATGCAEPTASNYDATIPKTFNDPRLCVNSSSVKKQFLTDDKISFSASKITIKISGKHELDIFNNAGQKIWRHQGEGQAEISLPGLKRGVYQLRLKENSELFYLTFYSEK